jgi:hypothetical protein
MLCKRLYSFTTQTVNGSNSQIQLAQSLVSLGDEVTIGLWGWYPQLIARTKHKLQLKGLRF